jgi:hypothetical protein
MDEEEDPTFPAWPALREALTVCGKFNPYRMGYAEVVV